MKKTLKQLIGMTLVLGLMVVATLFASSTSLSASRMVFCANPMPPAARYYNNSLYVRTTYNAAVSYSDGRTCYNYVINNGNV